MAHSNTGPTPPPEHRVDCSTLVRDPTGRVLVVRNDQQEWTLPGGTTRAGETLPTAARRVLADETGLELHLTQILAVDQDRQQDAPQLHFVFDGGVLSAARAMAMAVPAGAHRELSACAWYHPDKIPGVVQPFQGRRIFQALAAATTAVHLPALLNGHPTDEA